MTEVVYKTCVIKAGGRNKQPAMRLDKQGKPLNTALSVKRGSLGKKALSATSFRIRCCNCLTAMSKVHKKVWYSTSTWFQHGNNRILMPHIMRALLRLSLGNYQPPRAVRNLGQIWSFISPYFSCFPVEWVPLHCLPQQLLKMSLPLVICTNQNGCNIKELLSVNSLFFLLPSSWEKEDLTDFTGWWLRRSSFTTAERTCQRFLLKGTHETWIINNLPVKNWP